MNDKDFKDAIFNYNFVDRIAGPKKFGTIQGKRSLRFKICPCCGGKKWHFLVFIDTNTYSSFTQCCKGGDAFNYLVHVEKMDSKAAYQEIVNSVNGSSSTTPKKTIYDEGKKDLKVLQNFFLEIVRDYKLAQYNFKNENDPIRKSKLKIKLNFYEKYVDIFINSDYFKDYDYLIKISNDFFNLYSLEVIAEITRIEKYL